MLVQRSLAEMEAMTHRVKELQEELQLSERIAARNHATSQEFIDALQFSVLFALRSSSSRLHTHTHAKS